MLVMSKNVKIIFKSIELPPENDQSFDLEEWLADLLVDYWLSGGGSNKGDEIDERRNLQNV